MTQKRVKASDVIGNSYYIYTLQSSNNTPSLNNTINITCNVTDVYGQAISGKSITLYQNNTSKGTKTTDSSGNASWNSISMSSAGLQVFKVENSKIEVFVDNKSDVGHTHSQYLTEHQSLSNYVTTDDSRLSDSRTPTSHAHGNLQNNGQVGSTAQANKNVVTNSSGLITTEDKPTIPSASSTTPSADTENGSVGTGTTWARSNHIHPKSSLYAESSHNHTKSQITDFPTIPSKTSELTNDSGFLTSHQSLSGYLQTSDVKDNLTSTDTNKPLSANQGKELKSLIDNKEDNIYRIIGTGTQIGTLFPNRVELQGTFPFDSVEGKIIVYVVPDISSLSEDLLLDFQGTYPSGSTTKFNIRKSNDASVSIGEIQTGDELLLFYDNYRMRLIGNSSISGKIDTAGTGLSKSGTTLNHSNSITALTTASFKKVKYDSQGHITGTSDVSASDLPSHNHAKSQITDFPTIPSKTSELTNDSGFLTSHQSLSGYLQTSDVKDNLTSTDTNKPLSANQGKELKALIDSKEDNIEIFTGSVVRTSSTSAFLKAYTSSSIIEDKIILYKVPNISSIEQATNVALDYYMNNQTTTFYRKYVYKNDVQLTFGEIESNSLILLAYEGTLTNGQWNLISSSSYAEANHTHTSSQISDLIDVIYPIGSIYMSVNSTSPQTLFGGTWEQIKDKFLLSCGDTYANGTTGGSADAVLVSHNHATNTSGEYFVTSESSEANNTRVTYSSSGNRYVDGMTSNSTPFHHRVGTGYSGVSGTGKNMPPYLAVNVWKRIA